MILSTRCFLAFILALGGGVLSPALSFSSDYRFFATFYEENRATVFSMGTSGTIQQGPSFSVGYDPEKVAASPNGQLVVVSSGSHPQLSAFFINRDGTIDPPRTYDPLESKGFDPPFCFHPWKHVAFSRFFLTHTVLKIDYSAKRLAATSCTITLEDAALSQGYSTWSDHLYYRDTGTPYGDPIGVRGVGLSDEECFTTVTPVLEIPRSSMNSDFTVSPDGRWAVAAGISTPQMSIIKIHRDGSLDLHQQFSYTTQQLYQPERVRFTHDGKYLILLTDGPDDLISYKYDADTDLWVEASHAQFFGAANEVAISPDNRYLVWIGNYPGFLTDGNYYCTFQAIGLNEDGSFEYLDNAFLTVLGYPSAIEFIPPWSDTYPSAPNGVMAY